MANSARASHMEGAAAFRRNEIKLALQQMTRAVELDPGSARSWFYLGEIRRALDQRADARSAYQRCLEINSDHGRAIYAMQRLAGNEQ